MNRILTLFAAVDGAAHSIGDKASWFGPTLARLVVGTVFFQSGWGKLNGLDQVTEFFTQLGLPMPAVQAVLASTTEFVCGALLLVGLATRLAALPLIVVMIVAIRTALWDQVDGFSSLFGIAEFLYIALLTWIATYGPGPLSVDWLLLRAGRIESASALILRRA
jgi:putative oxidoreductase